ncbi:MAG: hydrogenase nickel incorporation protein HypB [Kiritimatiellia bacterium]
MCKDCGCENHDSTKPHVHPHPHQHKQEVRIEQKILARNDKIAAENRTWLAARHITAVNLISAPGSGKTLLLERTLERLYGKIKCGVIAGDVQTDNDARRLEGKGALVWQIQTISQCHLDAEQVQKALPKVVENDTKLVFIENVGNLVCPAAFDLGESFKVALISASEGEDKPLKYPALFVQAPVVVLTKTDLLPHLDFNLARCRSFLQQIHPGVYLFELSAKTGEGMDAWVDYLLRLTAYCGRSQ